MDSECYVWLLDKWDMRFLGLGWLFMIIIAYSSSQACSAFLQYLWGLSTMLGRRTTFATITYHISSLRTYPCMHYVLLLGSLSFLRWPWTFCESFFLSVSRSRARSLISFFSDCIYTRCPSCHRLTDDSRMCFSFYFLLVLHIIYQLQLEPCIAFMHLTGQ